MPSPITVTSYMEKNLVAVVCRSYLCLRALSFGSIATPTYYHLTSGIVRMGPTGLLSLPASVSLVVFEVLAVEIGITGCAESSLAISVLLSPFLRAADTCGLQTPDYEFPGE